RHIEGGSAFWFLRRRRLHRDLCALSDNVRPKPSDGRRSCFVPALAGALAVSPSYPPQNRSPPLCAARVALRKDQSGRRLRPWERIAGKESPFRSSTKDRSSSSRDSRKKIRGDRSCPRRTGYRTR